MLDLNLNIDAVSVDSICDESSAPKSLTAIEKVLNVSAGVQRDDSGTSVSSVVNADEARASTGGDADSSSTFNFDMVFNKSKCGTYIDSSAPSTELVTRQLFPVNGGGRNYEFGSKSTSATSLLRPQWLNLSVPEPAPDHQLKIFEDQKPPPPQTQVRKSRRGPRSRSSQYRGVTFYRRTGRWESHIWDCGKQVYLGGFDTAHAAARNNIEYCMEVMPTPSSDMEENALCPHKSKFKLREIARMQDKQSDEINEEIKFTDTTNLWLDMIAISRVVESGPLEKLNSPTLKNFDGAIGLKVPETRYLPVESTSDLLLFQSNLFTCSEGILTRNRTRANSSLPSIELGPEFAKVSDFRRRFKSIPSIIDLDSLKVTGDVWFGTGISLKGSVTIKAIPGMKLIIPDGALLENKMITSQSHILGVI